MPLGDPQAQGSNGGFAQLDTCLNQTPTCAREAIWAAFKLLNARMQETGNRQTLLNQSVFFTPSHTTNLSSTLDEFVRFIGKGAEIYNGMTSQVKMCAAGLEACNSVLDWTVAHYFQLQGCDTGAATALHRTPLRTFFNPNAIAITSFGETDGNLAVLFHEALHGLTGLGDSDLQSRLGCNVQDNTTNITNYLRQFVSDARALPTTITSCKNVATSANACQR